MTKTKAVCPTCGKSLLGEKGAVPPFCSERCRLIDLGRWLRGDYRVPGRRASEAEMEPEE